MTQAAVVALHLSYLLATALLILGLRRLGRVRTARSGNSLAAVGMLIAVVATVVSQTNIGWAWLISGLLVGSAIGALLARRVAMTAMPELVALFNGLGGAASAAVSVAFIFQVPDAGSSSLASAVGPGVVFVAFLSVVVGAVTLSGSLAAYGKLSGLVSGAAILLPARHLWTGVLVGALVCASYFVGAMPGAAYWGFGVIVGVSLLLGVLLVIPIGGADMPVVISLLNSYSGVAASMAGFVLLVQGAPSAYTLVVAGALVGASGLILTRLMCDAMNRSLLSVLVGGFGDVGSGGTPGSDEYGTIRKASAEEVAMVLDGVNQVIVVPGYGLAVAQAQHALGELAQLLERRGTTVRYAIHPVAGRMPGHMNVLLAEAKVPYDQLFDIDQIGGDFGTADVVIIAGANDVVNPAAVDDPSSPIAGMPIFDCRDAQTVVVIKRSLSPGYAGIKNPLFEHPKTLMLFADAKQAMLDMNKELKG